MNNNFKNPPPPKKNFAGIYIVYKNDPPGPGGWGKKMIFYGLDSGMWKKLKRRTSKSKFDYLKNQFSE